MVCIEVKEVNVVQDLSDKANLLIQALPYIQKFNKETIVIKYGGNAMVHPLLKDAVIKDIVLLSLVGINIVVVHGGGPDINDMLAKIQKESRFIDGLRYTDQETMDIVQQVLCGKVNKNLVSLINRVGGKAVGLCGMDGGMICGVQLKKQDKDYGLVGEIVNINPEVVNDTLDKGYIPVISSVAQGIDGNSVYNINADTAAAKLSVALGAIKLILLTDVRGIMNNVDDNDSLISQITLEGIPLLKERNIISGGMIPKVDCCVEALNGGVERTHIIDGRIAHSILIELLSDEGIGTMITKG
ncbi:MAG: acetylglutamate kinase [Eubacteriales bacterium]|nr:acetylglutamate kinase [Eubacteriales bacterium]MDD4583394.1 acetylglutamate kinase [Eubacteriales bacterium]